MHLWPPSPLSILNTLTANIYWYLSQPILVNLYWYYRSFNPGCSIVHCYISLVLCIQNYKKNSLLQPLIVGPCGPQVLEIRVAAFKSFGVTQALFLRRCGTNLNLATNSVPANRRRRPHVFQSHSFGNHF